MTPARPFSTRLAPCSISSTRLVAQAEPPSAEDLAARRVAKLASPVFAKAGFGTDLAAARTLAQRRGKPVFAYLTRSDAA